MNDNLTEIAVLVDRSGSMQTIWSDTLGGLRRFVEEQRTVPGAVRFTLAVFDTAYEVPYGRVPLSEVDLTDPPFGPRGGTALYDALGRLLLDLGRDLNRTPEDDRPGRVVVAVFTDGEENSSREFSLDQVKGMMRQQTDVYRWTFLFLAAGADALEEARRLAVPVDQVLRYEATGVDQALAYETLSAAVCELRQADPTLAPPPLQQTFERKRRKQPIS